MDSKPGLRGAVSGLAFKVGNKFRNRRFFNVAISCYKIALVVAPDYSDARLQLAEVLIGQGKYEAAGKVYKRLISLNPTLSTVYVLGLNIAKQRKMDDEFYSAILNLIETPEIRLMIQTLIDSPAVYQPSKLWLYFMLFNTFQLEVDGVENFKRTVNYNYFNWTGEDDIERQLEVVKTELGWSAADVGKLEENGIIRSEKPVNFSDLRWKKYTHFVCMLDEIARRHDRMKLMDSLQEPKVGNPISIEYHGRSVSQDISNSVMEINTIMGVIEFDPKRKVRVAELGAGHGRIANVLLRLVENIQVVIIDIPPALYVSQWYLSTLFPDRRVFRFRNFANYQEIQHDFEESEIAFLSPAQIEHIPEQTVDLFINISSLHEMTPQQIDNWFNQIDRVCKGWFYTKQYFEHQNPIDEVVIRKEDYPVKTHWRELLNQRCVVQKTFFEALYKLQ